MQQWQREFFHKWLWVGSRSGLCFLALFLFLSSSFVSCQLSQQAHNNPMASPPGTLVLAWGPLSSHWHKGEFANSLVCAGCCSHPPGTIPPRKTLTRATWYLRTFRLFSSILMISFRGGFGNRLRQFWRESSGMPKPL